MKKALILFMLLASITTAVAFAPNKTAKPSDYSIGITYEKAVTEEKPFVALFYVDWCSYCTKFMPKFKALKEIYSGKYNFVMINAEDPKYTKLARKSGVNSYPSVFIFDPELDSKILLSNAIYGNLGALREELDRYLKMKSKIRN